MNILQDLNFAARSLRARLGMATFAVLTLATGMAAALAIYCVIDALLLRALPYPQPDQLVQVREIADDGHTMSLAYPNYTALAAAVGQFSTSAFHNSYPETIQSDDSAARITIDVSGGDFFRLLGIAPKLGRTFAAAEHEKVAVIGHGLWQSLLYGRTDVLGQPLSIGGELYTIIGVMPTGFAFPQDAVAWIPMPPAYLGTSRSAHNFEVLGRLRAAADLGQARLAANALATRLKAQYGKQVDAVAFDVTPLADAIAAPVRNALLLLAAGTAFLLLIAITNTTNLLLALNGSRARELAVRAALGASRARLARQVLLESLLIAAAATVLALLAAAAAIRVLVHTAAGQLPRVDVIHLDARIVALCLLGAVLIALIAGVAVLWNTRKQNPIGELRESSRGQSPSRGHLRTRMLLLVGQTALTTVLLIGAGLLGRSFLALLAVDPGFNAEGAISVRVSPPSAPNAATAATNAQRYDNLMAAFASVPGVATVGGVSSLPLSASGADGGFWDGSVTSFDSAPPTIGYAEFRVASAEYFKAAGIPLLRGRTFDSGDHSDGQHVALISAAAARATWGERDPIGQRIQYGNMDGDMHPLTIVGVVGDVHERRLDKAPMGTVYVDLDQRPMAAAEFNIVVRSTLPIAALMPQLRAPLEQLASGIPYSLHPLAEVRASALADRRFSLLLFGAFAGVAFVLAIGGLYGLVAFAVGQREHEFALRQALGSSRRRIARLVLGSALRVGAGGITLGVVIALFGAHAARSQLFGVPASDPVTLLGVSALLLATLLLACLLPARRACAAQPRDALS
ncbi:MAG: ADOP family duplicated permease [Dokdonella sp.]